MKIDKRTKEGKEIFSERKRMFFLISVIIIVILLYVYFQNQYEVNFVDSFN